MQIDILCKIIDNFGDLGVCVRLLRSLRARSDHQIRLIIDKPDVLLFFHEDLQNIIIHPWDQPSPRPIDLVVETFGQGFPAWYDDVFKLAKSDSPCIAINLEYFSNEAWVSEFHETPGLLAFPNCKRFFFMPGLIVGTGGLMHHGRDLLPPTKTLTKQALLFTYELDLDFAQALLAHKQFDWQIAAGRTSGFIKENFPDLKLNYLELLSQSRWDAALSEMSFIFIRGEESLAHALVLGLPFLFQTYALDANEHEPKTKAIIEFIMKKREEFPELQSFEILELYINKLINLPLDQITYHLNKFLDFASKQSARICFHQIAKMVRSQSDLVDNLFSFYKKVVYGDEPKYI